MTDEKWVLDPPKSKYLGGQVKENNSASNTEGVETSQITSTDDNTDFVDSILPDGGGSTPISEFLSELKSSGDVKNHPLAWSFALLIVLPGVIIGFRGISNGEDLVSEIGLNSGLAASMITLLFDFLVVGQLFLGPGPVRYSQEGNIWLPLFLWLWGHQQF